jgi:hypothetical protein
VRSYADDVLEFDKPRYQKVNQMFLKYIETMQQLIRKLRKKFILDWGVRSLFQGKKGIRIGGTLRDKFQEYVKLASEIVDVDLAEYNLGQPTGAQYLIDATSLCKQ